MIYWSIEPSFVSGAELEVPDSLQVPNFDTILIISDAPGKIYSIAVKVSRQTRNSSLNFPLLKIDKNNIGHLVKGDKVFIKEFSPPVARQVLLTIDSKYFLPDGNWGNKIVNPAIMNQLIDIGQQIEFMYGNDKPMLVSGLIKASVPKAPAVISSETIFIIEKASTEILTKFKINSDIANEIRAKEYLELLNNENFDIISAIRNNSIAKLEKTFNFSQIDPNAIYRVFIQAIEKENHIFMIKSLDNIHDTVLGSVLSYPKPNRGSEPDYVIEFTLSAKLNHGICLLRGYSFETHTLELFLTRIEKEIRKTSFLLKEVPQVVPDVCGGCNARLELTKQNEKGIVFCNSCNTPNVLPFILRT